MRVKIIFGGVETHEIETIPEVVAMLGWAVELMRSYGIPAESKQEEENNEQT
jgi:hypothetical protein